MINLQRYVKSVRTNAGSNLFKDTKIYDMIMADINTMHFCTSPQSFNETTKEILDKWSCLVWSKRVRKELLIFRDYFIKQWLNPPFNNWQIFNTPPGYATTYNESRRIF